MPTFRDIGDAAAHLAEQPLPFTWYTMGPERDAIVIEVAPGQRVAVTEHFSTHPLTLDDGTPIVVSVAERRGASWTTDPPAGLARDPLPVPVGGLVGLDVQEAARRANAAGRRVRAHESEAVLTADYQERRINLCYDDREVVTSVGYG